MGILVVSTWVVIQLLYSTHITSYSIVSKYRIVGVELVLGQSYNVVNLLTDSDIVVLHVVTSALELYIWHSQCQSLQGTAMFNNLHLDIRHLDNLASLVLQCYTDNRATIDS